MYDRNTAITTRDSVATGGAESLIGSNNANISSYGRYVGFHSSASNLVAGDTNGSADVFVVDR